MVNTPVWRRPTWALAQVFKKGNSGSSGLPEGLSALMTGINAGHTDIGQLAIVQLTQLPALACAILPLGQFVERYARQVAHSCRP